MMSHLRRSLALAAGIGGIAIVLTATGAGSAVAQTVRPLMALVVNDDARPVPVRAVGSTLTHLGRPAADIVALRWWPDTACFKQMDPVGVVAADCYQPPAGQTLIVTDVQWWTFVPTPGNARDMFIFFDLGIVFAGTAIAGSNGTALGDEHLQTGFVFDPRLRVNITAVVLLRGYLVPQ